MFKDRFSSDSGLYLSHRPQYPQTLFDMLATLCDRQEVAWDCACGNGQATAGLAAHFQTVLASDASVAQLRAAQPLPGVRFLAATAEQMPVADHSLDLVCVAQALHWFDLPAFFSECARVLRPGGLLAVLSYNLLSVNPEVDAVIDDFYDHRIGRYWDQERRLVEEGYASVQFPFAAVDVPAQHMSADWSLPQLLGYLRTWSAVKNCRREEGVDPVAEIESRLSSAWGDASEREVRWPLTVIVRRYLAAE